MITLLLVDDEPLLRQGLRSWLERAADITVVGEASADAEAMALAHALHPDVVLMDLSMPSSDGIAATVALLHPPLTVRSCSSVSTMMRPCEYERTQPEQ